MRKRILVGAVVLLTVVLALALAFLTWHGGRPLSVEPPKAPAKVEPPPTAPPVAVQPPVSPERAKAEGLRKSMLTARDDARKVEAERLAPKLWTAAADKDREAEAALGKQDFARAQAGYTDARQGYQRAADEARKHILVIAETAKVRPIQEQAAQARRQAEVVDASGASRSTPTTRSFRRS